MKNNLVKFSLIATLFFFSCQKENVDSTNYFTAKIDNDWIQLNNAHYFIGTDANNLTTVEFFGSDALKNFAIVLKSSNGITPGTYVSNDSLSPAQFYINFTQNTGQYMQAFSTVTTNPNIQPVYTLTITSIGENEIRGKISGNYLYNATDDKSLNMTEAEFVAMKVN